MFSCCNRGRNPLLPAIKIIQICNQYIDAQTHFQSNKINQAACDLAEGVAREGGAYFAGSICQTGFLYLQGAGKDVVMKKFREEIEIFIQNDVDILIGEVSVQQTHVNPYYV